MFENRQLEPTGGSMRPRSLTERLEEEKKKLETRLSQINLGLEALKNHPEIAQVVNIISKL